MGLFDIFWCKKCEEVDQLIEVMVLVSVVISL